MRCWDKRHGRHDSSGISDRKREGTRCKAGADDKDAPGDTHVCLCRDCWSALREGPTRALAGSDSRSSACCCCAVPWSRREISLVVLCQTGLPTDTSDGDRGCGCDAMAGMSIGRREAGKRQRRLSTGLPPSSHQWLGQSHVKGLVVRRPACLPSWTSDERRASPCQSWGGRLGVKGNGLRAREFVHGACHVMSCVAVAVTCGSLFGGTVWKDV